MALCAFEKIIITICAALIIPVYEREINKVNISCIWNKFNKKVNNSLRKSHSYWPLLFDIFLCNIQWPHACTIK